MFFFLSKTLGIMLLPTNFLLGVGVFGAILLATRFASLGSKLLMASIAALAICGFSPLGNWLVYPLEARFPPWDAARGAPDGIVVLGGSIDAEVSAAHGETVFKSAPDRVIAAATLARRYPNARVVFSGGSANLMSDGAREADYVGGLFEGLGVARQRLAIERRSRNTWENALFAKQVAAPKSGERWLLVTSAYHMPRAVGLFESAGFPVEAYPVDWLVGGPEDLVDFRTRAMEGLYRVDVAVREWIGLAAYRISGKTSRLLPGRD